MEDENLIPPIKIAHLLENADRKGAPISIQWDKEDGVDWIIIKEQGGAEIMRVQKCLWKNHDGITGFTPEMRDAIIEGARRLYG